MLIDGGGELEVQYDKKVAKTFKNHSSIQKAAGKFAKQLKIRLDQLRAAHTYGDFCLLGIGSPHNLNGDLNDCCGISITANFRLIIKPCVDKLSAGKLAKCDTIIVKGVADYHGDKYNWIIP